MTTNDTNSPRNGQPAANEAGDGQRTQTAPQSPLQLAEQARAVPGQAVAKPAPGQTESYPLFLFANGVAFDWKTVKFEKTATGDLAIVFPDKARIELIDTQKLVEALEKKGNGAIPPLDDSLPILQQFITNVEPAAGEQGPPPSGHQYGQYDAGSIGEGIDHLGGLGDEDFGSAFGDPLPRNTFEQQQTGDTASDESLAPVNAPPQATDDTYQLNFEVPFFQPVIGGLLNNDSDPNADPVSITSHTDVSNGTLVVGTDGQFSYTPDQGFIGTDSFTYTITDGNGGTSSALVTLDVGDYDNPPVALPDTATTAEDTPVTVPANGVLANDSDPESNPITIIGNSDPANGTVTLGSDGSYVYTPDADFNGTDQFTYTLSDGNGGSASTTVTITVTPTNDVPDARDNSVSIIEGGVVKTNVVIIFDRSGSMNNDPGVEGYATRLAMTQAAVAKLLESGEVGSVLVVDFADTATTSGWTTVNGAVTYVNNITAFGPTNYDAALALTMSEFVEPHDSAERTVVYFITDGVPNNPVGSEGVSALETGVWEQFLIDNEIDRAFAVGMGAGVPNPSSDLEAIAWPNGDPDNPAYALYDVKLVDVTNESFVGHIGGNVITDNDPGDGLDTFGGDGAGYVKSIEIDGVVYTYDPGLDQITSINGTIPGSYFTADTPLGGKLTFYFADGSGHLAGDYSYLSPGNVNADIDEFFPYVIADVDGDEDTANLIIQVTDGDNRPPNAANDSETTPEETPITVTVLSNDSDLDGNTLTVTGNTDPSNGTVVLGTDGTFAYTPDTDFNGTDSFIYTITDGVAGSDTALVTITVTGVNDLPDALNDNYTTNEDTPLTVSAVSLGVLNNDTDADGDTLSVIDYTTASAEGGTVALGTDGTFVYTPEADFHGTDTFTYTITDGNTGATDSALVTVTVLTQADDPDALNDNYTTNEDTPLTVSAVSLGVLNNDTDADGDTLSVIDY
ncbi:MAG: Ig-like domain-containing protein, partial [Alphaproteobacteria bacterium]